MTHFSDEALTAYLDGEAAAELSARISAAAKDDPAILERLDALALDVSALKSEFDRLLDAAPQMAAPAGEAAPKVRRAGGWLKIAAGVMLALGIGWTSGKERSDHPDWQSFAAAYHRLYVPQTLAAAAFTGPELAAQVSRVSKAVGLDLAPERLGGVAGLTLKRAQVLGHEGHKIAHIAFVDGSGQPVALCIADKADDPEMIFAVDQGMQSARWSTGTHAFYLIGGTDAVLIEDAASRLAQTLGGAI